MLVAIYVREEPAVRNNRRKLDTLGWLAIILEDLEKNIPPMNEAKPEDVNM